MTSFHALYCMLLIKTGSCSFSLTIHLLSTSTTTMAAIDKPVLLSAWQSAYAVRVKLALAEKGVEFDHIEQDLKNKSPLLLQSNPVHKKVPVLIHNGKPICESLNIVEYIDGVWTNAPSLLPHDQYQRAHARFWADFANKLFRSASRLRKANYKKEDKQEFVDDLKILEGELGDKHYFGGDAFGYVDIALLPYYGWFYTIEKNVGFSIEEECPRYIAWVKRCMARENVSKILPSPQKMYEFACSHYLVRIGDI